MLSAGDIVDRYVVDGPIGRGGTARVYAARHRTLGTRHAIKVLDRVGPGLHQRLIAEGRAQAGLEHPNVLPVRDVLDVDGAPALLMPLVEGSSLDRVLCAGRLPIGEAVALFRGIVAGVAAIHRAGLVHRDLKPSNVLLEVRRDAVIPRVADFGLVLARGELPSAGFLGTPRYAAPEQRSDPARIDARTDVWALGCILFELLSGRTWGADRHLSDVPAGWSALVDDLLQLDRDRRPADGAAVKERLRGLPGVDAATTRGLAVRLREPMDRPPSSAGAFPGLDGPSDAETPTRSSTRRSGWRARSGAPSTKRGRSPAERAWSSLGDGPGGPARPPTRRWRSPGRSSRSGCWERSGPSSDVRSWPAAMQPPGPPSSTSRSRRCERRGARWSSGWPCAPGPPSATAERRRPGRRSRA